MANNMNLNELIDTLSIEETQKIYTELLDWQNKVHTEYYKKFGINPDNTVKNFSNRDDLVKFVNDATKFWVSHTPVFKKDKPIDVVELLKSKYCVTQTSILFKRAPVEDLEMDNDEEDSVKKVE